MQKYHGDVEIVSRSVEGPIHRYTYTDAAKGQENWQMHFKIRLKKGDTVGTLAWNTFRHFELYFGVSGIGCVVNTVNPRLFPEQLTYIINHAENQYLFIDLTFVELVESLQGELKGVKGFVILTDRENMPDTKLANTICYEELSLMNQKISSGLNLMKILLLAFVIHLEQPVIPKAYFIHIDRLYFTLG